MKMHVVMLCMPHFSQGIVHAARMMPATGSMACAKLRTACHPGLMLNYNHYHHSSWAHIFWVLRSWPRISETRVYGSRACGSRSSGPIASGPHSSHCIYGPRFSGPKSPGPRCFLLNTVHHHMSCKAMLFPATT